MPLRLHKQNPVSNFKDGRRKETYSTNRVSVVLRHFQVCIQNYKYIKSYILPIIFTFHLVLFNKYPSFITSSLLYTYFVSDALLMLKF
jgi:hypothetical protein